MLNDCFNLNIYHVLIAIYQKKKNCIGNYLIRIYCKEYKSAKSQKIKCTSKNKSVELNITLFRLSLLDTNPLQNKRVISCKNSCLKK